jgi:predicted porin
MDFKKTLIASTAIVAVGGLGMATADAASKPKLGISGYYELFTGAGSGDRDGTSASGTPTYSPGEEGTFQIIHYGEIRFKAKGKTDNGMKWGVYFEDVQNEADTTGKKCSTDEAHIYLQGSWGKLELGGQDGPGDKTYAGAEKLVHISPALVDAFVDTSGFADEKMSINDSSDSSKITYYTPRVSGFQAGYSYAPSDEKGTIGGDSTNEPQHEGAVEYKGKISGGKLRATWGFGYMATDATSAAGTDDPKFGWRAGVTYGMGPWTVAGGYKDLNEEGEHGEDGDKTGWDLGVAYSGGPYEVALIYQAQEAEDSAGNADYYHVGLTGAYNLGSGLTVSGALYFYDLDNGGNSATFGDDTSGTVGVVALGAKF